MEKKQQKQKNEDAALPALCLSWFKTARKARKEKDWQALYHQMIRLFIPDVDPSQLFVPEEVTAEHLQLLLNSLTLIEVEEDSRLIEYFATDIVVLLSGTLAVDEKEKMLQGPIALLTLPPSKNERVKLQAMRGCVLLRGERKQLQKFKNDILRLDRQNKQEFLSKYLFCGITPIFPQFAVKLIIIKEDHEIDMETEQILLLEDGLISRKPKNKGEGSELTTGSLISIKRIASLLQFSDIATQTEVFTAKSKCRLLSFQTEQFMRILHLNSGLKALLLKKIKLVVEERIALNKRSLELAEQFQSKFKTGGETMRIHYPIEFKSRPKTACLSRSFRKKYQTMTGLESLGDFITFDRYEKMLSSKERVATTKASYQQEARSRTVVTVDYERKMKQQNKMFKLQSSKIQKLSQRESKAECSQIHEIKKSLFRVTHLFDEPFDPSYTTTLPSKANEFSQSRSSQIRRMSGIKPEQFLKSQYLSEFYKKTRPSTRDQELSTCSGNKQNNELILLGSSQEGILKSKGTAFKIVVSRP